MCVQAEGLERDGIKSTGQMVGLMERRDVSLQENEENVPSRELFKYKGNILKVVK